MEMREEVRRRMAGGEARGMLRVGVQVAFRASVACLLKKEKRSRICLYWGMARNCRMWSQKNANASSEKKSDKIGRPSDVCSVGCKHNRHSNCSDVDIEIDNDMTMSLRTRFRLSAKLLIGWLACVVHSKLSAAASICNQLTDSVIL